jgi:mevalonate kinase
VTGEAGGKLLLFGEHAAVYGRPAVGLGVPWRLRLRFLPAGEGDETGAAAERLRDACRRIGVDAPPAGALEVRSEIPFGVGLGSSAALCVALAHAVGGAAAASGKRGLWDVAHRAEHAFHGSPSGIDTGLALLGGVQRFTPAGPGSVPAAQPIAAQRIHLIAGLVPRRGDTAAHVAAVRRRMQAGDDAVRSAIDRLGAVVEPACRLLAASAADRAVRLGALADEADELLASIGVGSPAVVELLAAARCAGATGGKISGGGGGGAFVAFVRDRDAGLAVLDAVGDSLPTGDGSAAALLAVDPAGVAVLADRGWPAPVTRRVRVIAA